MKTKALIIFLLISQLASPQWNPKQNEFTNNIMFSITVDWSRAFENPEEFDSGADIVISFIPSRNTAIEPMIKFEFFPAIDFYKMAVGANYVYRNNSEWLEIAAGVELSEIIRGNVDKESYSGWLSFGFNFETRLFIIPRLPLIMNVNNQYRTDFGIYGADPKFVTSLYFGVGWVL